MKTIYVQTKRVVSHNNDQTPIYEEIVQKLDENSFKKFIKYLPYQNYVSAIVNKVIDINKNGEIKKLNEIKVYQELVNQSKLDKKGKTPQELYEEEKKRNDNLEKRLQELEKQSNVSNNFTDDQRVILKTKAEELKIDFNKKIESQKLLEKIQQVEPEFKL